MICERPKVSFIIKCNDKRAAMGKCDLSIELESASATFRGGEKVRGHVRLDADADVRCRSLMVYAGWRTRGSGNVASETGPKVTLFAGELIAGQSQRSAFELETLQWPPTYHGFHLNIEHFVEATADIPWAFDPKTSVPIQVVPAVVQPDTIEAPRPPAKILQFFVFVFLSLFLLIFAISFFGPQLWVIIGGPSLILVAGLVLTLIFKWLPQLYVGKVEYELQPQRLSPGELLSGFFSLQPSRTIHPRFIHFRLTATEVCVSGSGTNQKTHRHELVDRVIVLADQPVIPGDQVTRFKIRTRLPPVAAYSLKLTNNELRWVGQFHVGIAGLVDWKEEIFLSVVPPGDPTLAAALAPATAASVFAVENPADLAMTPVAAQSDAPITFAETVSHIEQLRDQADQVELLIEAVAGIPLAFTARIDRRLLVAGVEDVLVAADEQVVWAEHEDPHLPLSLYVPRHLSDDLELASGTVWATRGEIVGWDRRGGRLQVRVLG
jgi:hypothetical protein